MTETAPLLHIEIRDTPIPQDRREAMQDLSRRMLVLSCDSAIGLYEIWQTHHKEHGELLLPQIVQGVYSIDTPLDLLIDGLGELSERSNDSEEREMALKNLSEITSSLKGNIHSIDHLDGLQKYKHIVSMIGSICVSPRHQDYVANKKRKAVLTQNTEQWLRLHLDQLLKSIEDDSEYFDVIGHFENMPKKELLDVMYADPDAYESNLFDVVSRLGIETTGSDVSINIASLKIEK